MRPPYGSYNDASDVDKSKYEWYCEKTTDGYLVFKNVADPTKYLGYNKVTDTPYKWSINTVLTQRFGVPLMNGDMQYLAIINDGSGWQGDVKSVHDQTQPYSYETVDDKGDDDASNDETLTHSIDAGICTDFVFIPVPLTDGVEKKITITANELVERNTRLLYDSDGDGNKETYSLPFSRMFVKSGDNNPALPELHLLCNSVHGYKGIMVDGVAANAKATLNGTVLSFNFDEIKSGEVLDVQFEIAEPFEYSDPDMSIDGNKPALYVIKNMRSQGVQQQARPKRAAENIEIGGGEDDGPISSQTGVAFYAKFEERDLNMGLVQRDAAFDATSLFYFTETEDDDRTEYYSTRIHSVTTVMKCASDVVWNTNGNTWYVQPKKTASYTGYNIGITALNANNNPSDAWCSNHADGDKILHYEANDDGAAWMFEKVEDDEAKELLKKYIDKVADALNAELGAITPEQIEASGYDAGKIGKYITVVGQFKTFAVDYYTAGNIAKLVRLAQNIHMLEHEIDYALYELPLLSDETKMDKANGFANPHWYYIKNVSSENRYAAYNGDNNTLALSQFPVVDGETQPALKNLFYFAGYKNTYAADGYVDVPGNNLIIDEYLEAHIHNFMSKGKTFVSKNVELMNRDDLNPGQGEQTVVDGLNLKSNESWSIELEYDLGGTSLNAYGSCLLAGSDDPLKDNYANEFQVYFKDDRSIVIKVNNAYDTYRFWHTQDNFSHIKVVITYSQQKVTLDVYNSLNEKESKTITGVTLKDVTKLTSALPAEGATLTRLATYQVEAMTWKEHVTEDKDLWYILPSSNLVKTGFAIVLDKPNDTKMGWTNGEGNNTYVASDLGTHDNSTWKFERVVNFDSHLDELLAMYGLDDAVIYNKELVKLYYIIEKSKTIIYDDAQNGTPEEEAAFNEVYDAILNYTGPMPEELRAPKPGVLYTIRHIVEEDADNALLVFVDKANGKYTTKEVYQGTVMSGEGDNREFDSRGVWMFEGNEESDGFFSLTGLKAKNIHTQCYLAELGNSTSSVNEENPATINLGALGCCFTKFQVGSAYMDRTTVNTISYDMNANNFWGSAVQTYPSGISTVIDGFVAGNVHRKSVGIQVDEAGNVDVTFTYDGGSHKINILGVEIVANDGSVKYSDYRHQTAGGAPNNIKTYTLEDVAPGVYTLNCYVYNFSGNGKNDDKLANHKGHFDVTGVSKVSGEAKVTDTGNENTRWIIEEIADPTKIYHKTFIEDGYSTLMLGFNSTIPSNVEAYTADFDDKFITGYRYLSMNQVEGTELPAMQPVVLRHSTEGTDLTTKFYYNAGTKTMTDDGYMQGSLYFTVVPVPDDVNLYMLQQEKDGPKMYWIYEEYDGDGDLVDENGNKDPNGGSNDAGGHVLCKANRAYILIDNSEAQDQSVFMFSFKPGDTTGIFSIDDENYRKVTDAVVEGIYDIHGRKLSEITQPGIYIVNGKKVVVK